MKGAGRASEGAGGSQSELRDPMSELGGPRSQLGGLPSELEGLQRYLRGPLWGRCPKGDRFEQSAMRHTFVKSHHILIRIT